MRSALALIVVLAAALLAPAAQADVLSGGNGIYTVYVESETGRYTVTTGPQHPLGPGLNVLFGDGLPSTSTDSIHSFTSGRTYALPELEASTVPLGTTGFRSTYTIEGEPEGEGEEGEVREADDLTVVQEIQVHGSGFADSRVEVSTVVTNHRNSSAKLGVRYLWDYQIGEDDGPTFQQNGPDGPILLSEQSFPAPSFDHYTIEDNDTNPAPPTFDVLGTVDGPPGAEAVPPTLLENASWPESMSTEFEYRTGGADVSTEAGGVNDDAVLYYWGDEESDAPVLAPEGGSYRASASMYLTRPHEGLPHEQPPAPPAPRTPPVVTITAGPPRESAATNAAFEFTGAPGGSFECSLDDGRWRPCASGQAYRGLAPGDHLFRVREVLGGLTSAIASYRWTVDLPRKCVLRVARARVFVFARRRRARLVIHYTSYRPAKVTVAYAARGRRGKLALGSASARFKRSGVFRLPVRLTREKMAELRGAKRFKVRFRIPRTPHLCGRYYAKQLTIRKRISGQTVWFQADSRFAP